jgi:predicted DNA-binding transcriptional regulator AlpA
MSKYLSPAEVCARLDGLISEKTLANWRCDGNKGPTFIKIGGRVFYVAVEVDAWINKSMRKEKT